MTEELKTPWEWAELEGVIIRDPDGWRGKDDPSMDAPTTYKDYQERRNMSTITCNDMEKLRAQEQKQIH